MKNKLLKKQTLFPEFSFLILRFSTGIIMFYYHGWSKLVSDTGRWERLGNTLTQWIGFDALSIPLGFMAAFSESIGALFIAIGLLTRPAAFLLLFTMLVACSKKISEKGIDGSELPIIFLILSFIILLRGAGKYSLDYILF